MRSGLRLRSVKFKSGGEVRLLHDEFKGWMRDDFEQAARDIAAEPESDRMSGFAVVTWSVDGAVACTYRNTARSKLQTGDVPNYVRDVLAAEMAAKWK